MRPRFQADADFNYKIVVGLRRRELAIDIIDAHEGGVVGAPDPEVLTIAADAGRILISHDRKTMPAISYCSEKPDRVRASSSFPGTSMLALPSKTCC
jgi:hypothetical protein